MEIIVTLREKRILDCIKDEYKSYQQISKGLDLIPSGVVGTLKYFVKVGYIEKHKMSFKANDLDFVVENKLKVIRSRTKDVGEIEREDDLKPYQPSEDEKQRIGELLKKKMSRTEMAKLLNMSKSSLLWSIYEMMRKDQDGDERSGNFLYVDRLTLDIYKLIQKSDYTILQIAKHLQQDVGEVRERILYLEKVEAIKVYVSHNVVNYIPLNKILKLRMSKGN